MAEIQACSCKNDYQDEKYGTGMRLKNKTGAGGLKCTVCGSKNGDGKKTFK